MPLGADAYGGAKCWRLSNCINAPAEPVPEECPLKLNVGTLVLAIIVAIGFGYYAGRSPLTPHRIIGLCITAVALVLFAIARIQLGRAFSVEARASELVTTGLYSRIRNPIYIFGALLIAGIITWFGYFWFFLAFLVIIPLQVVRARNEA